VGTLGGCSPRSGEPAAGRALAGVDRAIVDQARTCGSRIDAEFVSERVGNYQYKQQWGSGLLDQLWVR